MSTPWIKASRSDEQGSCVEQRWNDGVIEVKDSKDRSGPVLDTVARTSACCSTACTSRHPPRS